MKTLAVVPGDGIGPEVVAEALKALNAVGANLDQTVFDLGADRYLRTGEVLPDSVLSELSEFDAILLGAVGDPRVPPGVLEGGLLLALRRKLDLYVNLRPARLFEGVPSPFAKSENEIDLVIVRENTEGLYAGRGRVENEGFPTEKAIEESLNTAASIERIIRYAFELANAEGRKLTLVHKTNVLERAGKLYLRLFAEVGAEYPMVETDYQHVDAAALLLASDPSRFSAIVTDNLFGDILSDLTAALVGGIGFVGSGNIHPGKVSVFEPVHGSAPDIAGTGKANPIGAVLSAALMLRHLGENDQADHIEQAVMSVASKAATGTNCSGLGDSVADAIQ